MDLAAENFGNSVWLPIVINKFFYKFFIILYIKYLIYTSSVLIDNTLIIFTMMGADIDFVCFKCFNSNRI